MVVLITYSNAFFRYYVTSYIQKVPHVFVDDPAEGSNI